ncbi:MAG: hypothetical protein DRI75_12510 [Bacteroidetes bacterium]|nr:MAG: hypothetical protein DRI75_12510 [Bacteroidota bacterium]
MDIKKIKIILIAFLILPLVVFSQEKIKDSIIDKPERPAFEGSTVIDNQTNVLNSKNTLEIEMSHRFGLINGGENDLAGFWAPSNIRIGISYAILDRVTVGYGTTKFDRLQDFSLKVALLRQTRSNKIPLSVTFYGNATVNARKKENFLLKQHRYSYFNQIIIAKRFSPNFSVQIAASVSHYNLVEAFMENDRAAVAVGGRLKISPNTAIMFDFSQPLTQWDNPDQPDVDFNLPGVSFGLEFATSGHVFQLLISNYNGIVPQKNYMFNQNDFFDGDFLIGFNITRKYNF